LASGGLMVGISSFGLPVDFHNHLSGLLAHGSSNAKNRLTASDTHSGQPLRLRFSHWTHAYSMENEVQLELVSASFHHIAI
jgi:hypothetical protein